MEEKTGILKIILSDKASSGIKTLGSNLQSLEKTGASNLSRINKSGGKALGELGKTALKTTAIIGGVGVGIGALGISLVKTSAKAEDLSRFFESTFGDAELALERLGTASKGTISDISLMEIANSASLLGVSSSVEELSSLMVTARLRGKAMGLDTTTAFETLVRAIGRGSVEVFDDLGIQIPQAMKETIAGMDGATRAQELMTFAMKDGAALSQQLGGDVKTTTDKFAQFTAQVENTKQLVGEKLTPTFLEIADWALPKIDSAVERSAEVLDTNLENSKGFWAEYRDYLTETAEDGSWASKISALYFGLVEDIVELKDATQVNLEESKGFWTEYAEHVKKKSEKSAFSIDGIIGSILKLSGLMEGVGNVMTLGASGYIGDKVLGRAVGGSASGMTLVGERGPELVNLPNGSFVHSNDATKRMSSGSTNINITIGSVDNEERIKQIARAVQSAQARDNTLGNYQLI